MNVTARELISTAAFAALLAWVGYWIGSGNAPVKESMAPAPQIKQQDGSVVLERQPDAAPAKPPHKVTGTEIRRITTRIKPDQADCDPVTVTTSITQLGPDIRAISSANGGQVIGGMDVQIKPLLTPPKPHKWSAGASFEPRHELYGAWVARDLGRLRIGADIQQNSLAELEVRFRVGFSF